MAVSAVVAPLTELRQEVRYGFCGLVPARLETAGGRVLDILYIDVSTRGLGILAVDLKLQEGEVLRLSLEGQGSFELYVRWIRGPSESNEPLTDLFTRAGLYCPDEDVDLLCCFDAYNCVDH